MTVSAVQEGAKATGTPKTEAHFFPFSDETPVMGFICVESNGYSKHMVSSGVES
jgi:hypothetical protein